MLFVYLNYPNSRVSAHSDPGCGHIRSHRKQGQRTVDLDLASLSVELRRFADGEHKFFPSAEGNDMWLNIACGDLDFEVAIATFVHRTLAAQYKPFGEALFQVCRCDEVAA